VRGKRGVVFDWGETSRGARTLAEGKRGRGRWISRGNFLLSAKRRGLPLVFGREKGGGGKSGLWGEGGKEGARSYPEKKNNEGLFSRQ